LSTTVRTPAGSGARLARFSCALLLLGSAVACEAGPSAFDEGRPAATDSALELPESAAVAATEPPRAPEVEGGEPGAGGVVEEAGQPLPAPPGESSGDEPGDTMAASADPGSSDAVAETDDPAQPLPDSAVLRFERPEHVRGIYLNAWASGSTRRVDALLELAAETEINTFVLDIKDATGYLSHRSEVPLAQEIGANEERRIRDLPGLLEKLHAAGIYPVARIVIVKDPLLAAARPELAVQDTAGGPWVDGKGIVWLNPYDSAVWDYHLDIAREVAAMGFPEIQWDYVRFPDAPRSELERAIFPGAEGRTRAQAIRELLAYTRRELGDEVQVTADVFGVTTSAARDVGIGQVWEEFIDVVDVALPMVYPSHYWRGSFGIDTPNAFPYEIVKEALEDAVRRSEAVEGAGITRPWLQDFTLGAPAYGAPEVRAQIQATYDAGLTEWILWNPGSSYTPEALEPVDGWAEEPLIRVADQVVPVSRRWEVLEAQVAEEDEATDPDPDAPSGGSADGESGEDDHATPGPGPGSF